MSKIIKLALLAFSCLLALNSYADVQDLYIANVTNNTLIPTFATIGGAGNSPPAYGTIGIKSTKQMNLATFVEGDVNQAYLQLTMQSIGWCFVNIWQKDGKEHMKISTGGRAYCSGVLDSGTNTAFIQICTLKNVQECNSSKS